MDDELLLDLYGIPARRRRPEPAVRRQVLGWEVYDRDGRRLGRVHRVWQDPQGHVQALGIAVGNIFNWKVVVAPPEAVREQGGERLRLEASAAQLADVPAHSGGSGFEQELQCWRQHMRT